MPVPVLTTAPCPLRYLGIVLKVIVRVQPTLGQLLRLACMCSLQRPRLPTGTCPAHTGPAGTPADSAAHPNGSDARPLP